MSVNVIVEKSIGDVDIFYKGVIGYVIALVVKHEDDSITLEREIRVCADSGDDNVLAESVVKAVEAKLNEAFPDPNKEPESKIWVPK